MPQYHFDLTDGHASLDIHGTELRDSSAARVQAVIFAGEYLADHPGLVADGQEMRVVVREPDNGVVCTVVVLTVDG